jgi:hypothetical protein
MKTILIIACTVLFNALLSNSGIAQLPDPMDGFDEFEATLSTNIVQAIQNNDPSLLLDVRKKLSEFWVLRNWSGQPSWKLEKLTEMTRHKEIELLGAVTQIKDWILLDEQTLASRSAASAGNKYDETEKDKRDRILSELYYSELRHVRVFLKGSGKGKTVSFSKREHYLDLITTHIKNDDLKKHLLE